MHLKAIIKCCLISGLLNVLCITNIQAQYFGKNKVGYQTLDFRTITSPHIQLYYYNSDSTARKLLTDAEKWYKIHQHTLKDTIPGKNPLIIYNNHADFQQTTLFNQNITPGTGGVTESIRNRVVMPYTHINKSTNHVLGHEMVHAFQYNLLRENDTLSIKNVANVPLWIIEGMAEFLSIGRNDTHTAMWMRNAVLDDFPSLAALNTPRYFPYRYGHAFWAFVAGVWGEEIIRRLFMNINIYGLAHGLSLSLGYSMDELSHMWRTHTEKYYQPFLRGKQQRVGEVVYADSLSLAISPAVSPDGRYCAFFTQIDPISGLDLVLADAANKKIIRKVSALTLSSHIDFLSILESSPTWSPDSEKIATIIFSRGKNKLSIIKTSNGKIIDNISLPGVSSLMHPSWSPDGTQIALSGMRDGQSDLYLLNLGDHSVRQLTQDKYSDIQPSWSADGQHIIFSTDRANQQGEENGFLQLAILHVATEHITRLPLFEGADNLDGHFTPDGNIIFLSDRDGFRNLYKYDVRIKKTYLMTDLATGISGITRYSQATSFSPAYATIYYSLYTKGRYEIVRATLEEFQYLPVDHTTIDKSAGILPPKIPVKPETISSQVNEFANKKQLHADSIKHVLYKARFKLDDISSTGIGISNNTNLGTGLNGGVAFLFSDMLRNNEVYALVNVNGEIYDIGLGAQYLNKKHRIDWGGIISHFPYLAAFSSVQDQTGVINGQPILTRTIHTDVRRTFEDNLIFISRFPFSSHLRLEGSVGATYISYKIDRYSDTYVNNEFLNRNKSKQQGPNPLFQASIGSAWVGDNTKFGFVGPLAGYRYRIGIDILGGSIPYNNLTVDGRLYKWWKPMGLAIRVLHTGRYGKGAEDHRISPLNVAVSSLVHGHNFYSIYRNISNILSENNSSGQFHVNDYIGSKILVANVEIRIPFTGPRKLALIPSNALFTEIALFIDGGRAFSSTAYTQRLFGTTSVYKQQTIYSTGLALRVNLFGFYVLEPYVAFPFRASNNNTPTTGIFGINFLPAW